MDKGLSIFEYEFDFDQNIYVVAINRNKFYIKPRNGINFEEFAVQKDKSEYKGVSPGEKVILLCNKLIIPAYNTGKHKGAYLVKGSTFEWISTDKVLKKWPRDSLISIAEKLLPLPMADLAGLELTI